MCVPKDIPDFQRQMLQQLGRDHVIGVTGAGELSSQRNPDATDHDRQMQLPTVPPAMISRLAPGRFGINRGMRDVSVQIVKTERLRSRLLMAYPVAMDTHPSLPPKLWERTSPAIRAHIETLEGQVQTLTSMIQTLQEQVRTL